MTNRLGRLPWLALLACVKRLWAECHGEYWPRSPSAICSELEYRDQRKQRFTRWLPLRKFRNSWVTTYHDRHAADM